MLNDLPIEQLKSLNQIAQVYDQLFVNKRIEYIYRDMNNKRKILIVQHDTKNFMHLCGINHYHPDIDGLKNSKNFFKHCLSECLSPSHIWYKDLGTVNLKLVALKSLNELITDKVLICESGTFTHVKFDNALRTNKMILAVSYIHSTNDNACLVPNSALSLSHSKGNSPAFTNGRRPTQIRITNISDGKTISNLKIPPRSKAKKN